MGVDLLDVTFRVEDQFGVKLDNSDWESLFGHRTTFDVSAGELHFLVGAKLGEAGKPVPRSCWNGIRLVLAKTLGIPPNRIKPESRLVRDLSMM